MNHFKVGVIIKSTGDPYELITKITDNRFETLVYTNTYQFQWSYNINNEYLQLYTNEFCDE